MRNVTCSKSKLQETLERDFYEEANAYLKLRRRGHISGSLPPPRVPSSLGKQAILWPSSFVFSVFSPGDCIGCLTLAPALTGRESSKREGGVQLPRLSLFEESELPETWVQVFAKQLPQYTGQRRRHKACLRTMDSSGQAQWAASDPLTCAGAEPGSCSGDGNFLLHRT